MLRTLDTLRVWAVLHAFGVLRLLALFCTLGMFHALAYYEHGMHALHCTHWHANQVKLCHCMQVAEVETMEALSAMFATGDATVDLDGRQISLAAMPPSQPPDGLTPQRFCVEKDNDVAVEASSVNSWKMAAAANIPSWTLSQKTAALANATIQVPRDGCLYVCAKMSRWQHVHVHGAIFSCALNHLAGNGVAMVRM